MDSVKHPGPSGFGYVTSQINDSFKKTMEAYRLQEANKTALDKHFPNNADLVVAAPLSDTAFDQKLKVTLANPKDSPEKSSKELLAEGYHPMSVAVGLAQQREEAQKKPTNPKQAYGDKKPPLQLIHSIAMLHESAAMHSGKLKYGENNFLKTPIELMTYAGAILRHTEQYISGERVDRKELVHHLGAVRACCNILLTAEATGNLIDNRPTIPGLGGEPNARPMSYREATAEAFAEVEDIIAHLNTLYPPKDKP